MSRALDLSQLSRNMVTADTSATDRATMEPLMMHSVTSSDEHVTVPANLNTMMIGPITMSSGKNLIISSGATLVII